MCQMSQKKKSNFLCETCFSLPSPFHSLKFSLSLRAKIDVLKSNLENNVTNTIHFYIDFQELKAKQLKIANFQQLLPKALSLIKSHETIISSLNVRKSQKEENIKKLLLIRPRFKSEITVKKALLDNSLSYI